ncbi:MAG TPA: hypothetical protein VN151_08870, partial [Terracidiphilus sp.]|nr:hypothetical protein [Terracidiphilus sp.]
LRNILADFGHSSLVSHRFRQPHCAGSLGAGRTINAIRVSVASVSEPDSKTVVVLTARKTLPDTFMENTGLAAELQPTDRPPRACHNYLAAPPSNRV